MLKVFQFFFGAFSGLFSFLAAFLGAKASLTLAIVAVFSAVTLGAYVAIQGLISGLVGWSLSGQSEMLTAFLMAFWSLWPSNAATTIAAIFGADVVMFIYRYKAGLIQTLAK